MFVTPFTCNVVPLQSSPGNDTTLKTSSRAASVRSVLSELNPQTFQRHPMHGNESHWSHTNCYLDAWIEILSSLDLDPIPALASAVSAEFLGDQWEFLKVRSEDLEALYGIRFGEYDTWKPLREHVETQLQAGNLNIVEVDAFYLPDTEGVSYRRQHSKTSIVPTLLDAAERRMRYFHNGGLYELFAEDFEHTIGVAAQSSFVPSPYLDLIRLDGLRRPAEQELRATAKAVLRAHLHRTRCSKQSNPMAQLTDYVQSQQETLAKFGLQHFHQFSFATTRQAGLSAMLAAELSRWFAAFEPCPQSTSLLIEAAEAFTECSSSARKLQFQLARVAAGRKSDLRASAAAMNETWLRGVRHLQRWDALN